MNEKILPKEWEAIVDVRTNASYGEHCVTVIRTAVERCFALANKPQRELTDAEIDAEHTAWLNETGDGGWRPLMRRAIAAHQRKQQEPETVTFRAARNRNDHSEIYMAKADSDWSGSNWEWLPGEPQTIEVKLP